tara:strand:+ start:3879 stop:4715 length:837 start_codon:yes stop_codon:yes gene_type:complete
VEDPKDLKSRLYRIIFEADTPAGKLFDVALLIAIVISTALVCLETIPTEHNRYSTLLLTGEWILTGLFTIEYALRLYCSPRRKEYATSFFGVVDFLSVMPAYLALFTWSSSYYLVTIRLLRLLRVFRILKLIQLSSQAQMILRALRKSMPKIGIFFFALLILVFLEGTLMYLIEGGNNPGFNSIPNSVYWAIVTMTTVGYGDVAPLTPLGKMVASLIMLSGYAIIAVPTGIVTAHITRAERSGDSLLLPQRKCKNCELSGHTEEAQFCRRCGDKLPSQ